MRPRGDDAPSLAAERDGAAAAARKRRREQATFILGNGRGSEEGLVLWGV
jgi:hypothetical protein